MPPPNPNPTQLNRPQTDDACVASAQPGIGLDQALVTGISSIIDTMANAWGDRRPN